MVKKLKKIGLTVLLFGALPIFASCFLVPQLYGKHWLSIPGLALMIGWIALMLYPRYRQRQKESSRADGKRN